MSTVEPEVILTPEGEQLVNQAEREEKKRRRLLLALLALLLGLCAVLCVSVSYLINPVPLPELLPGNVIQAVNYPPTYKFSIYGVDQPMGVGVSPDGQRIYVSEGGGERLVKMFDREGRLIRSFSPPGTSKSNRQPVYIAVDATGRVFVVDRYHSVINLFDADGNHLDAIIGRDMTLSKFVAGKTGGDVPASTEYYYNALEAMVYYRLPGGDWQFAHYESTDFSPLGVRFDPDGNLHTTDLTNGFHGVLTFSSAGLQRSWQEFSAPVAGFGAEGSGSGQHSFPNSVVKGSKGILYVADSNNRRIVEWDGNLQYQSFFGFGASDSSLNLPSGMWLDGRGRLHVVDTVGQTVHVYNTAGASAAYLYSFGSLGISDGEFNYPSDITIDFTGRLYVTDRENNRVQIWAY